MNKLWSWLPWHRQRQRPARNNTAPLFRPCLETLEHREVLSTVYATTNTNRLLQFDSFTPNTVNFNLPITGLVGGATERIEGIDFRPRTGQLFALGIVNGGAT